MVAHRGARAHWPDNTIASYRAAIEAGATAVEVDLRMTRDGHLIAMHDPFINRTTTGHGLVKNIELAYLQQQQIITAPDQQVPTLSQVLNSVAHQATIMLDLKEEGEAFWRQLAQILLRHPQRENVVLGVRSLHESMRLMELLPGIPQLALSPKKRFIKDFLSAGVKIVRMWPEWLKKRPELARSIQESGAELYVPTRKNGFKKVKSLLCFQPEYIQTDDPIKLTATLERIRLEERAAKTAPQ